MKPLSFVLHIRFTSISNDSQARQSSYRALFQHQLDAKMINDIRQATNKGMVIGSDTFKDQIEKLTGNSMHPKKMGRPFKVIE
ncbi:hypothetical protein MT390_15095 [Vibrio sp. 2-Bac 85]